MPALLQSTQDGPDRASLHLHLRGVSQITARPGQERRLTGFGLDRGAEPAIAVAHAEIDGGAAPEGLPEAGA